MELLPAQQKIVDEVNQRIDVPWLLQEINYYPDKIQTVMETVKAFCPLHKETKFRSLIIDVAKKSYRCTLRTCPGYEGGKLIDLFARLQNLSQLRAALVLAKKLNINIDQQPLRELSQEYTRQAKEKIQTFQIPQALGLLEQAIELDDKNIEAHQQLAEIFVSNQEIKRAVELYNILVDLLIEKEEIEPAIDLILRNILANDPGNEVGMYRLAILYEKAGKKPEALQWYQRLAKKRESENRLTENIGLYKKILELEPANTEVRLKLAQLLEAQGKFDLAIEQYWALSKLLIEEKNLPAARESLNRIKQLQPEQREARKLLVDVYLELHDYTLAERELLELSKLALAEDDLPLTEEYIQRLLSINPNSIAGRELLLEILIRENRLEEVLSQIKGLYNLYMEIDQEVQAIEVLQKGKAIFPEDVELRDLLFNLYCETGENSRAISEGIELAELLLRQKQLNLANKIFNQLLALAPQDQELHQHLVENYLKYNLANEAVEQLRQVIKTNLNQGMYNNALQLINTALEISPDDLELLAAKAETLQRLNQSDSAVNVYLQLATLYLKKSDTTNAEMYLNKALELAPQDEAVNRELANFYKISLQHTKAISILRRLLNSYARQEKWEQLIEVATEILSLEPQDTEALILLADANVHLNRISDAIAHYQNAANTFLAQNNTIGARACLEKALELDPRSFSLLFDYANLLFKIEGLPSALPFYRQALKLLSQSTQSETVVIQHYNEVLNKDRTLTEIRRELIDYLFAKGKNEQAIQELHTLAKTFYEDLGEYDQALATLQTLKTYEPDNYNVDEFIARIYEKKGELHNAARFYWSAAQALLHLGLENEALAKLQQVIRLEPNDESALEQLARLTALRSDKVTAKQYYLRLAAIRREQGREDDNEPIYRKLLELDDQQLEVRRNLAWLLLKRGDNLTAAEEYWKLSSQLLQKNKTAEAIEALQQCLELNPALTTAMDELLSVYQRLNKTAEAIFLLLEASRKNVAARQFDIAQQYLKKAEKLAPEHPQVIESLAELYLTTDSTDEAIKEYKRLVKIYKTKNELTQAAMALEKLKLLVLPDESIRKELAHLLAQINQLEKAAYEWADLLELQLTRRAKQKELQALLEEAFPVLYNFPDIVTNITQRLIASKQESLALQYLIRTASALEQQNKDEQALKLIETALAAQPENLDALKLGAQITKKLNKTAETINYLKQLAKIFAEKQDFQSASETLEAVSQLVPEDVDVLESLASAYLHLKQLEKAEMVLFNLARLYQQQGRLETAIATDLRILEFRPDNINIRRHLAELYLLSSKETKANEELSQIADILERNKAYDDAIAVLDRILSIRPNDISSLRRQILLLKEQQGIESIRPKLRRLIDIALKIYDSPAVVNEYRWAINHDPENYNLRIEFAGYLEKIGSLEEAKNELCQVANLLETTAGDTFEAITVLERAHKLSPSDIPILTHLGELYYKSGEHNSAYEKLLLAGKYSSGQNQLAESIKIYRRLIELMPEQEEPYLLLGEILEKQGNKTEAVKTYLQLMEQHSAKGRERENIPLMVKVLELEPERKELRRELAEKFAAENLLADATYHFTVLGSQYEKEAHWDKAIAAYSRVKELNPENIECREHLADLYLKTNAPEKAKQEFAQLSEMALARNELAAAEKYFLRIVEIDPNDIAIGERLGKLYEAQGNINAACQEYFRVSERFVELGKADRAIEVLNRIKALQPQDITVREKILELWQAQGATTEAAEESLSLCELLFTCGLKEEGVGYCKNIINLVPDSPPHIIKAAKLLLKHHFVNEALDKYFKDIEFFIKQNDFVNALIICDEALKDFADNIELHNHRINILLKLGRIDEVVDEYLTLAEIYKQLGEKGSVARCLEKILELQPDNLNARQELVEIYLSLGLEADALSQIQILIKMFYEDEEYETAEKYCYRALELDATNYAIREILAESLQNQKKFFEAIKEYVSLAEMLTQTGELHRAREIYQKILQIDPENLTALTKIRPILVKLNDTRAFVEVSNQLLQLYDTQGAITEAIEVSEEIAKIEPDNIDLKHRLAKYYEQNDQIENAINIYEKLADTYLKQKNIDQAIIEREQIRRLRPQYVDNLIALGRLYQQQGDLDRNHQLQLQAAKLYLDIQDEAEKALKITETFIKLNGEDIEALTLHAQALKKLHRFEEAATELALLAKLEEKQGNLDLAITYLEEALNLSVRRFEEREHIIKLLLQKGDTAHATEHLSILAQLYETNNRIPEAAATYERIINLNPDNLVAHQRLFEIHLFLENKEKALEQLLWLADYHQQRKEVEKAEQLLIQGVKLHPDSLPLHQRLTALYENSGNNVQAAVHQLKMAELYLMSGDISKAIGCLEKVRSYQPDNMETRRSLALLYLRQGNLNEYIQEMLTVISIALEQGLVNESEKYVQDLLTVAPDDMQVRDKIAQLYLQNKIPEMAVRQYLELAQILLNRNQLDTALQAIDKVIVLDPNNITTRELLLQISIQEKNLETARKVVNELVEILVAQRRTEKAISVLQQALKTFTDEIDFREQLAQFLEKINRSIDAVVEWRKLAETCIRLDKLEKAASIYKHISEILPDDTRAIQDYIDVYSRFGAELELIDDYLNLIQKFVKRGAFLEAEQTFQRLLKIAPQNVRVLENYMEFLINRKELDKLPPIVDQLIDIYMQSGDLRNAEKILQRVTSVLPRQAELYLKLADVLLLLNTKGRAVEELKYAAQLFAEQGQAELVLITLRKIVSIHPEDTDTRIRIIEQLTALGRINEAVTDSFALADLFVRLGFLDLAEREYRRIVSLQPTNFTAWSYLFDTHLQLGTEDDLIEDYKKLARIYVAEGHPEEASKLYKKLIHLQPNNIEFHHNYIDTYLQFGMETELIDEYLELAELLIKQNKLEEAEKLYQKIIKLQPDNQVAKEKLEKLTASLKIVVSPVLDELDRITPAEKLPPQEAPGEETFKDTINNYLAILELNPQNALARCKLAEVYDQLGKPEEAYKQLATAAKIFIDKGELERGIEICQKLLHRNPADVEIRKILNRAELQRSSFKAIESAIEYIDKKRKNSGNK